MIVRKAGLKVALIGYENANIKAWLSPTLWEGMEFLPIVSVIQKDVDMVRAKEHPDVVVAILHSATGQGDGSVLESEALDVMNSVSGVDFVVCGHDHRPYVETRDTCALINSGSHSRFLGYGTLEVKVSGGKVVSKEYSAALIPVMAEKADPAMREAFHKDYEAVKAFTLTEVGVLNTDLVTREAYMGMCPYLNLIHTVSLGCAPAEISFAAPLTYNGTVKGGILRFNDLFTIYPFENQLYVVKMKGSQVLSYLETSYDKWIRTIKTPADHVLNIAQNDDPRTGQKGWSFVERAYNFDSAGGINYTVDVTTPFGSRVNISGMASGEPFDLEREYNVAMTSYRASGGGGLLSEGAGIDTDRIDDIVAERYPEIRNLIYDYLLKNGSIDPETIGNTSVIGSWKFIPEAVAAPAVSRDMKLLFGEK
jgi:2',3'-cyclic-nucleotide 2'-phosphodiesterase/3'-nucleotidase